ncbi:MAG: hypothetical protein QOG87_256 [Actinomycetota bacterium]|jgi:hypothetical protein
MTSLSLTARAVVMIAAVAVGVGATSALRSDERDAPTAADDGAALATVTLWLAALGDCNPSTASHFQRAADVVPDSLAQQLCEDGGAWGATSPAADGAATRRVPVEGPGEPFVAVVAPVGDTWRVLTIETQGDQQ